MPGDAHVVLQVQGQLKIVAPIAPIHAVLREYRVFKEYSKPLKVPIDSIQYDDVGGDNQKVAGERRTRLIELVIKTPCKHKAKHLGLAGAGRHLYDKAPPGL